MADTHEDVGESIHNTMPVISSKKRPATTSTKDKSKKAKKSWCYEETIALINIMEKETTQSKMDGLTQNGHVWREIADEVANGRNGDQCPVTVCKHTKVGSRMFFTHAC